MPCVKLSRVPSGPNKGHIVATAGSDATSDVFVRWYIGKGEMPTADRDLIDMDSDSFLCLILTPDGLFWADKSCLLVRVSMPFYAIGCGAPLAMGAMEMGASAKQAVLVACKWDSNTHGPVSTMRLEVKGKKHK